MIPAGLPGRAFFQFEVHDRDHLVNSAGEQPLRRLTCLELLFECLANSVSSLGQLLGPEGVRLTVNLQVSALVQVSCFYRLVGQVWPDELWVFFVVELSEPAFVE